jgi:hypothetical protein
MPVLYRGSAVPKGFNAVTSPPFTQGTLCFVAVAEPYPEPAEVPPQPLVL